MREIKENKTQLTIAATKIPIFGIFQYIALNDPFPMKLLQGWMITIILRALLMLHDARFLHMAPIWPKHCFSRFIDDNMVVYDYTMHYSTKLYIVVEVNEILNEM